MQLTKNFTVEELTHSDTALAKNIDNTPEHFSILLNLYHLFTFVVQPVRAWAKRPFNIMSCFRAKRLNRILGGAASSDHVLGCAVDFTCWDMAEVFKYIALNCEFDQLIWEKGDDDQPEWIHVSHRVGGNRNQILKFDGVQYRYIKVDE